MSSNYTGSATASQSPSQAPGPNVPPIVNEPSDGDGLNAASVMQAPKTLADHVTYIQKSVRLAPAVLPASTTSGYTAPVYSSFGGTVTPSGNGTVGSSTGTNFIIKIVAGGAVGVATYKISSDGGATFGGTHATAASLTDLDTGITLAFAGTLTTNGTAQFLSALTPVAVWTDAAGNFRHLISPNGFPMGRRTEFRENWVGFTAGTTAIVANYGHWQFITTSGAAAAQSQAVYSLVGYTGYPGTGLLVAPASTATIAREVMGTVTAAFNYVVIECEFEVALAVVGGAANNDWYIGFTTNGTATWATAKHTLALRKLHNGTNWFLLTGNGTTETATDTGFAPSAGIMHRVKLEWHGSATAIGTSVGSAFARVSIDGNPWVATTTTLPANDMNFYLGSSITNGADSMLVGPLLYSMNRYATLPAF